jgi:2-polyprenyl-6-hydroxyphenyl methylase/3-demethylubiquinone-9 3-methyltransferase
VEDPTALESGQYRPDSDGHLFLLTPDEVRDLARSAGLTVEHIGVFGGPLASGHLRLSRLASRRFVRAAYLGERCLQLAPGFLRTKLGAGLTAILKVTEPGRG